MAFDRVIGQEAPGARLMEAVRGGRLPHALLLHGPSGTGTEALAIELAKAVNCRSGPGEPCQQCHACLAIEAFRYPDVHVAVPSSPAGRPGAGKGARPDARMERRLALRALLAENPYTPIPFRKQDYLSIDDVRALRREASAKPFEGRRKVMVLIAAERMNVPASNALLKTLEEPPGDLLLILTTPWLHRLLPTILSRCRLVHLSPLPDPVILEALLNRFGMERAVAQRAVRHAGGSLSQALMAVSEAGEEQRTAAQTLFEAVYKDTVFELFERVERLADSRKDAPVLEGMLDALTHIYRKVFLRAAAGDTTREQREGAMRPADRLTEDQAAAALASVEEIKHALAQNAHGQLALTVLALRLRMAARQDRYT